jgi:DNA-directed RNA polymerase subunit RPC12/RpoP
MDTPSGPSLKETRMRQCPHCLSAVVAPLGRVTASIAQVRVDYQCHECSKAFVLLR